MMEHCHVSCAKIRIMPKARPWHPRSQIAWLFTTLASLRPHTSGFCFTASRHRRFPVERRMVDRSTPTEARNLRIQIASDLHIEFFGSIDRVPELIIPHAPVLALLGDVGLACTDLLRDFVHLQCERFQHVLFLAGNHEFYNDGTTYSMNEQTDWMRQMCSEKDNLHFMEKECLVLDGVAVLGTTLWSRITGQMLSTAERSMNDYHLTYNHRPGEPPRRLKAAETSDLYLLNVAWIRSELAEARRNGRKAIVLTHHTPLMEGTSHPQFDDSDLSCCFSSDLRSFLQEESPTLVAWACGHTHYNFDFLVGNVRVCSNQLGYKFRPNEDYREEGVVLDVDGGDGKGM